MGEPGGLPSMGSHRVGHDWSDLAVAVVKDEWEASRSHWALCLACRDWPVKHRAAAVVMVMLVQQQHRLFKYFLVSFLPCRACSPWGQLLRALWWDQAGHGEMACPQMPHLRLCGLKMMPAIAVNKGCPAINNRSHPHGEPWGNSGKKQKHLPSRTPTPAITYTCPQRCSLRKLGVWKHRGLAPGGWGAYPRNDFSEPRFSHLPIHRKRLGNSLAVPWLGLCASAASSGLIPGQGTKIPHVMQCSLKK